MNELPTTTQLGNSRAKVQVNSHVIPNLKVFSPRHTVFLRNNSSSFELEAENSVICG